MIEIRLVKNEPVVFGAVGAAILDKDTRTILEIYEHYTEHQDEAIKLVDRILKSKHMIVGHFLPQAIIIQGLTRLGAMYIWRMINTQSLVFASGLETSLRISKVASVRPNVGKLGQSSLNLYQKAIGLGIPAEDARAVLLEGGTETNIILSASHRDYLKIANALMSADLPELQEMGETISKLVLEDSKMNIPRELPATTWPFWGEEKIQQRISLHCTGTIPSITVTLGTEQSYYTIAQLVRERPVLISPEPLEQAARSGSFDIPLSFSEHSDIVREYKELALLLHQEQMTRISNKDPTFADFLCLGQRSKLSITLNGYGAITFSQKRCCGAAQRPIRIPGIQVTRNLLAKYPDFEKELGPGCWKTGRCIESPRFRANCGVFAKYNGQRPDSLNEVFKLLATPQRKFSVI